MRRIGPLLLLLSVSTVAADRNFKDDVSLYANLTKTLEEISMTPVENLTLAELSAALGVFVPLEHRYVAMEMLDHRNDRTLGELKPMMMRFGDYDKQAAEEFSRGAIRALIDKPYVMKKNRKLDEGDHLCRCNLRECASVSNELYGVMGPEFASFCRVDALGYCVVMSKTVNGQPIVELYCSPSLLTDRQKDEVERRQKALGQIHDHRCRSTNTYGIHCCKGAMCNDAIVENMNKDPLETALEMRVKELDEKLSVWQVIAITVIVCALLLLLLLTASLAMLFKCVDIEELKKRLAAVTTLPGRRMENGSRSSTRYSNDERPSGTGSDTPLINQFLISEGAASSLGSGGGSNPTNRSFFDAETTVGCGTGSGGSLVAQRTLSSNIRITAPLGQGKFGRVYLGEWRGGEKIAVKKFDHVLYDSFEQEVEILMSGMMSNSNILRWIGKDTVDTGSTTEFWIMSEYHPNGSLYDYMDGNPLSQTLYLTMMRGIANGISFLHSEIPAVEGTMDKKGVAHRDLKTKNILVKSDLTCVIADFGMAVMNERNGVKLPPGTKKSGTVRYLAPEILRDDSSVLRGEFEFYRAADMYSFALIMWECGRRTNASYGNVSIACYPMAESLAYHSEVSREPSIADMKAAVVDREMRPPIDDSWNKNPVFFEMARIMHECWSTNSIARLTALNVKIVIDRLSNQLNLQIPAGID